LPGRAVEQRAEAAVQLDAAQLDAADLVDFPPEGHQHVRHPGPSFQRPGQRRRLAAAIAVKGYVGGEQRFELLEVALLEGIEEALREPIVLLARGLESRLALTDVAARPDRDLADRRRALVEDLGDAVVGVVEDLAQEEDGALLRRQGL